MGLTTRVAVDDPSGAGAARRAAAALARSAELDEVRAGEVQLVAAELATNLHRHAGSGEILLRLLTAAEGGGVEVVAVDRGPGIARVAEALHDGFSTAGGQGTGLGAVRRVAGVFDVHSVRGAGTVVLARVTRSAPAPLGGAAVGAVCLPVAGERVSGDGWSVCPVPGGLRILVADGVGHGPDAADASDRAVASFRQTRELPLEEQLRRLHEALRGSRGAAVAIAELDLAGRAIRYAGVGNISGRIVAPAERRGLASVPGTIGHAMRSLMVVEHAFPPGALLLLHSDGCRAGWSLDDQPGALRRHPALVAALVWRDWARPRDDSTVVVVRDLADAA